MEESQKTAEEQGFSFQENKWMKIKKFLKETRRILRITKKPTKEEFKGVVKITALGSLIIGLIGFILFLLKQLFIK